MSLLRRRSSASLQQTDLDELRGALDGVDEDDDDNDGNDIDDVKRSGDGGVELSTSRASQRRRRNSRSLSVSSKKKNRSALLTTEKREVKLNSRLAYYTGVNPFAYTVSPNTCYEKMKLVLFIVTGMIIVKFVIVLVILLGAYLSALLLVTCRDRDENGNLKEIPRWRRPLLLALRLCARSLLFVMGVYYIPVSYDPCSDESISDQSCCSSKMKNRPITMVFNHVSFMDGFLAIYVSGGVPVAKKEVRDLPILGLVTEAIGTVFVDRASSKGRKGALDQIRYYQNTSKTVGAEVENTEQRCWCSAPTSKPPLFIFPQGTVSNAKTVSVYKAGAFAPHTPVQPILLRHWNMFGDPILDDDVATFFRLGSQLINFVSIEVMEPYMPNEEESENPRLYAENVRLAMAKRLGCVSVRHGFEDIILRTIADKKRVNRKHCDTYLIDQVVSKFKMKPKTVLTLATSFNSLCDSEGIIDLPRFKQMCLVSSDEETAGFESMIEKVFNLLSQVSGDFQRSDFVDYKQELDAMKSNSAYGVLSPINIPPNKLNSDVIGLEHFTVLFAMIYHDIYSDDNENDNEQSSILMDDCIVLFFVLCDMKGQGKISFNSIKQLYQCINAKIDHILNNDVSSKVRKFEEFITEENDDSQSDSKRNYQTLLRGGDELPLEMSDDSMSFDEWFDAMIEKCVGKSENKNKEIDLSDLMNRVKIEDCECFIQWTLQWVFYVFIDLTLHRYSCFLSSNK